MKTVVQRTFSSTPNRDAGDTWREIVDLLTHKRAGAKRDELLAVHGVVSSIIADKAPKDAAIVVTCDGPRTRIYCVYDEDATDGSNTNEDALGFDPLNGDWRISLPCEADDLAWIQGALKKHSERITARDKSEKTKAESASSSEGQAALVFDPKGFLGS